MNLHKMLVAVEVEFQELQKTYEMNLGQIRAIQQHNKQLEDAGFKLHGRKELLQEMIKLQSNEVENAKPTDEPVQVEAEYGGDAEEETRG